MGTRKSLSLRIGVMQPKNHLRVQVSCAPNKLESYQAVQLVGYVGPLERQLGSFHTRKDGIFLQEIAFGAGTIRHK